MRKQFALAIFIVLLLGFVFPLSIFAQEEQPPTEESLTIYTTYPSQVIGIGETINMTLKLKTKPSPIVAHLEAENVPEGWLVEIRGGGRAVRSVYVDPDVEATVDLRITPPKDVKAGTYQFVVTARGGNIKTELPIELTVKEKTPPRLTFDTELPTLKGSPTTTFRFDVIIKNEGDEDISVNLSADVPDGFLVSFKLTGQDVTNIPLGANESKRLNIEVKPITDISAGSYPITVLAQGGNTQATLELTAEVSGQPDLTITTQDGRLSGQVYAGRETPIKILIQNNGSAPALGIEMSSSEPSGWLVEFEPKNIREIPAGNQVEVTAKIKAAEKAVTGDYVVTVRVRTAEGLSESAEFRITVLTSTLWGVVGVILIAIAVGVVAIAVMRFGRR